MIIRNSRPDLLDVFEAKALRNFRGAGVKTGDTVYGCLMPNNRYYLSKDGEVGTPIQGEVFNSSAVENVDFARA